MGAKLCEVQNYMTFTNHIPFVSTYIMNNAKYQSVHVVVQTGDVQHGQLGNQAHLGSGSAVEDVHMEENIMKLKKLTALTLALSLALSLTACGGGNDSTSLGALDQLHIAAQLAGGVEVDDEVAVGPLLQLKRTSTTWSSGVSWAPTPPPWPLVSCTSPSSST